jgi:hypothetical protein
MIATRLIGLALVALVFVVAEGIAAETQSTKTPAVPQIQADDGSITLHGRHAAVLGTTLRYEPEEKKQTLGFWTKAEDAAEWTFTVRQAGEFDIEVLQGCGKGQGGSTMAITLDAGREGAAGPIEFVVEDTGHFQAFKPRVVGRVSLAAGSHTLHVQPRKIAKAAACDIREMRLIPAAVPAK